MKGFGDLTILLVILAPRIGQMAVVVASGGSLLPAAGPAAVAATGCGGGAGVAVSTAATTVAATVTAEAAVAGAGVATLGTGAAVAGTAATTSAATAGAVVTHGVAAAGTTAASALGGPTVGATIVAGGPVVWVGTIFAVTVIGAEEDDAGTVTFDCWKRVLHDNSSSKSFVTLDELVADGRVTGYHIDERSNTMLVRNKWNETFSIEEVTLPSSYILPLGKIVAHARPCSGHA